MGGTSLQTGADMAGRSRLIGALVSCALVGVGLVVSAAPPASAAATYNIMITGDSITQGSSGDYTWRYRLWNKLASTAAGEVAFVGTRTDLYDNVNDVAGSQHYAASFAAKAHAAAWGTTFIQQLPSISSQVSTSGANVLVVMLGSNDLAFQTSPAATVENLRTYISRARAARPGIDVVVSEVVNRYDPWAQTYWVSAESNEYASRIATLAAELNTSSQRVVVAPTRSGWDAKVHTWDGTHPNPTGEKLIAQRISEGLAKIGGRYGQPQHRRVDQLECSWSDAVANAWVGSRRYRLEPHVYWGDRHVHRAALDERERAVDAAALCGQRQWMDVGIACSRRHISIPPCAVEGVQHWRCWRHVDNDGVGPDARSHG